MKRSIVFVIFIGLVLSACGPSQEQLQATVQASIAETQAALPTDTFIPPTDTPIPPTNTPLPTATETVIPSPTPDLRVIDIDPRKLLLEKSDLPPTGSYILPGPDWTGPTTNAEIVSAWTVEDGRKYLAETGRIHGWTIEYYRNTSGAVLPQNIYNQIVLYSSIEGAQLVATKYGNRDNLYTEIDAPAIGDVSKAYTRIVNGFNVVKYNYTYHNIYVDVQVYDKSEENVSIEFAMDLAEKILKRLEELPLSNTVTFMP